MTTTPSVPVAIAVLNEINNATAAPLLIEVFLGCWALAEGSPYPTHAVGGLRALGQAVAAGEALAGHPWPITAGKPIERSNAGALFYKACRLLVWGPDEEELEAARPSLPGPAETSSEGSGES